MMTYFFIHLRIIGLSYTSKYDLKINIQIFWRFIVLAF